MPFRTVLVNSHCKLEYSLNYLVYRTVDTTKRIVLDEVHTIILQTTAASITSSLLSEITSRGIKLIVCDQRSNPVSELVPYHNHSRSAKKLQEQISWNQESKDFVWQTIIKKKIENQAVFLKERGKDAESEMLMVFANDTTPGDITNREGHAAKVYFNRIFFDGFTRDVECFTNAVLDYGYTILLSQINREVAAAGYASQLGIHHKSEFNEFNLSCDLIEPWRNIVDRLATRIKEGSDFKQECISLLSANVLIAGKHQTVSNAIGIYCDSVFVALSACDPSLIKFPALSE